VDLIGDLVKLRALAPEDAPEIASAVADPEVVRFLDNWAWRPYGPADAQEFISRRDPAAVTWAIECLEDGAFLGCTGLDELDFRNRNCMWGVWIAPPSRWNRGYGTEACRLAVGYAFRQLGMEKVYLRVYEGNDRGRRAYAKAGFEVEATLPRDHWVDGRLVTSYLMAVYRDHPLYG
jgi:RimJ/RimL family protein N-acetyltransferase